jgi:hypothetical protein
MIAFVHVAKTAGRTVNSMFRSAHGVGHYNSVALRVETPETKGSGQVFIPKYSPDDIKNLLTIAPGIKSLGGHHVALWSDVEEVVPDVTYFLFLRDPIKRGASHYQYNQQQEDMTPYFGHKHLTWDQWVDWEIHHNHQVKMLSKNVDPDEAIRLIESKRVFVGLMDRFDESLVLFKALFQPKMNIAYLRKNTATDKSIAQSILGDDRKVDQIKEMYAKEFPVYDYVLNEVYPRYIKEYGSKLAEDVSQFKSSGIGKVNYPNLLMHRLNKKLFFDPRYKRYMQQHGLK